MSWKWGAVSRAEGRKEKGLREAEGEGARACAKLCNRITQGTFQVRGKGHSGYSRECAEGEISFTKCPLYTGPSAQVPTPLYTHSSLEG